MGTGGLWVIVFLRWGGAALVAVVLGDFALVGEVTGDCEVVILVRSASGSFLPLLFGGVFRGLGGSIITFGIAKIMRINK